MPSKWLTNNPTNFFRAKQSNKLGIIPKPTKSHFKILSILNIQKVFTHFTIPRHPHLLKGLFSPSKNELHS